MICSMIRSLPNGPDRIEGAEQSITHRVAESVFILKSAGLTVRWLNQGIGIETAEDPSSAWSYSLSETKEVVCAVRFQFERASAREN